MKNIKYFISSFYIFDIISYNQSLIIVKCIICQIAQEKTITLTPLTYKDFTRLGKMSAKKGKVIKNQWDQLKMQFMQSNKKICKQD